MEEKDLRKFLRTPGQDSIWGGKEAVIYFNLLRQRVEEMILDEKDLWVNTICINFNYCEKRKKGDFQNEEYSLAVSLADVLISLQTAFPLPLASVAVYLLKKGILDEWCKCS
jgi:hypothetical protein